MTKPSDRHLSIILVGVSLIFSALAYNEADKNSHLIRDNVQLKSVINDMTLEIGRQTGRCPGHDTMFRSGEGMRYLRNNERRA